MEAHQSLQQSNRVDVLDLLITIARRKRLILCGTLAVMAMTLLLSFIMIPVYKAKAQLMPPQGSSSGAAAVMSQLGGAAGMLLGGVGSTVSSSDMLASIMKSEAVVFPIVSKFDLIARYNVDDRQSAGEVLAEKKLELEVDPKSSIISLSVEDLDPRQSAELTNAFLAQLETLMDGLTLTENKKKRMLIAEELKTTFNNLKDAEEAFQAFQEHTGAISIDSQAVAVLQAIASVRAQIAAKEVQLQAMRSFATPNNPDVKRGTQEIEALRYQLKKLEETEQVSSSDMLKPTGQLPGLGKDYLRRLRDVRFQEAFYELLVKQYEAVRIEEQKDPLSIQVISTASPPEKAAKPKRMLMLALACLGGGFTMTFAAVALDFGGRELKKPHREGRFRELKSILSRW